MCCFSAAARTRSLLARIFGAHQGASSVSVARTRIFARRDGTHQAVVYAMELSTAHEVAMILPLPVALPSAEDAVRFVDLSAHVDFFTRLDRLFSPPISPQALSNAPVARKGGRRLVVHKVGAFEASYVPSAADFARLDPRFRLPPGFLDALPTYADHGFAVFRLAPARSLAIHPMAFRFPSREPARLFFPTVHVHDGRVHPTADFDHVLYWQGAPAGAGDATASGAVTSVFNVVPTEVLAPDEVVHARTLRGHLPNMDTWVA